MEDENSYAETVASSLNVHSLEPNVSGDVVSVEDLAWVDSCLISDSDTVDKNWDSLKDALQEIVNSQPQPHYSADRSNDTPRETGNGNFHSSGAADVEKVNGKKTNRMYHFMEVVTPQYGHLPEGPTFPATPFQPNHGYDAQEGPVNSGLDLELLSHVAESPMYVLSKILNDQSESSEFRAVDGWHRGAGNEVKGKMAVDDGNSSETKAQEEGHDQPVNEINFSGNPFRPDYNDDIQRSVFVDTDLNADFSPFEMEPVTNDIFREWELNIPEEEDEFVEQFNKTLEGDMSQPIPSNLNYLAADTKESVDSLIAAVKGLTF